MRSFDEADTVAVAILILAPIAWAMLQLLKLMGLI